jgi:chromosomal replication initiation ATPase DnaA
MSLNTTQALLDEYNYKINISAYENLTERERRIHQSAFMTGYKLGQEHTIKSKTITKFIYKPNKNREVRTNIGAEAHKRAQYIFNKCIRFYNRTYEEIVSPRRLMEYAICRSMIVNLLREMTTLSLPAIGKIMGGRDHTTIIHHTRLKAERRRYWSVHHITWKHYEKLYKDLEIELKSI